MLSLAHLGISFLYNLLKIVRNYNLLLYSPPQEASSAENIPLFEPAIASLRQTVDDAQSKTVIDEGQIAAPVEKAVGVMKQFAALPNPLAPALGNEADQSGHLAAIAQLREEIGQLRCVADKTHEQAFRLIDATVAMEDMLRAHVGAHGQKLSVLAVAHASEGDENGAPAKFRDIMGDAVRLFDSLDTAAMSMRDAEAALNSALDQCELKYVQRSKEIADASAGEQGRLRDLVEEGDVRKNTLREAARQLADTAARRKAVAVRCGILERTAALLDNNHFTDTDAILQRTQQAGRQRVVLEARRACVDLAVKFVGTAQQAVDAG